MGVTKSINLKEDPLDLYVDFLNVNLSADPRPMLKKRQRLKGFLDQFERENQRGWFEEAKNLQGELRNDLFPIAARKEIPEKLFPYLERWVYLTEKLNEMNFIRRWDPHPHKTKKDRVIIKGWNFKPTYNQRDIWYLGLAERLEDGDLQRLRLCPICNKYFSAKDERQRFCGKACKVKYDNKDAKVRVKRWRMKQKGINENIADKKIRERADRFSKLIMFAVSNSQDIEKAGPLALKLGEGDANKGWKMIEDYYKKLKNGVSPNQIFKELPTKIRNLF